MQARIENGEVIYTPIEENKCPFEVGDVVVHEVVGLYLFEGVNENGNILRTVLYNSLSDEFVNRGSKEWSGAKKEEYTKATTEQEVLFNQKCIENGFWFDRANKKWIELKEGDIYIISLDDDSVWISILKSLEYGRLYEHVAVEKDGKLWIDNNPLCRLDEITSIYEAEEEQKMVLYELLEKEGKQWNDEKKCVEDLKWKPKMGELYWCVNDSLKVCSSKHHNGENSHGRVAIANCFKTQEECEKYAEYMRECSLKYKEN